MRQPPSDLTTIVDTDDVSILCSHGNTGHAVVAFTGVGRALGGIQTPEFQRSLANASGVNSVYYVIDRKRSWYEKTFDPIRSRLELELADFDRVTTLGNSMGGFGALLFGSFLPRCDRAVALVPQYSLAPHVVGDKEPRWGEYRSAIDEWRIDHALVHSSREKDYFVLFGAKADAWHRNQFHTKSTQNIRVYAFKGSNHRLAENLRDKGILVPLLDGLVNRFWDFEAFERFLRTNDLLAD